MMRIALAPSLALLTLTACVSPQIPDSAAGVGGAPSGVSTLPPASAVTTAPLGANSPEALAADTAAALGPPQTTGAPLSAMGANAATSQVPSTDPSGLSDEQDFSAVSGRETIESDAARIAANRAQYQVIEPSALPERPDGSGASIVAYALATTNVPGQPLYKRLFASQSRMKNACGKYGSADRAQEAFLDSGGPRRDRYGMDPDGDGFACYWDPRPFRAARGGAPDVIETYEVIETPGES